MAFGGDNVNQVVWDIQATGVDVLERLNELQDVQRKSINAVAEAYRISGGDLDEFAKTVAEAAEKIRQIEAAKKAYADTTRGALQADEEWIGLQQSLQEMERRTAESIRDANEARREGLEIGRQAVQSGAGGELATGAAEDQKQGLADLIRLREYLKQKTEESAEADRQATSATRELARAGNEEVNALVAEAQAEGDLVAVRARLKEMTDRDNAAEQERLRLLHTVDDAAHKAAEADRQLTQATREKAEAARAAGGEINGEIRRLEALAAAEQSAYKARGTLTQVTDAAAKAHGRFGSAAEEASYRAQGFTRTIFFASQGLEDLQYSFAAVVNNIPLVTQGVAQAMGKTHEQAMGWAAAISIVAVGINQLIVHWGELKEAWVGSEGTVKNLAVENEKLAKHVKELGDKARLSAADVRELDKAEAELAGRRAERKAQETPTSDQDRVKQQFQDMLKAGGLGEFQSTLTDVLSKDLVRNARARIEQAQAAGFKVGPTNEAEWTKYIHDDDYQKKVLAQYINKVMPSVRRSFIDRIGTQGDLGAVDELRGLMRRGGYGFDEGGDVYGPQGGRMRGVSRLTRGESEAELDKRIAEDERKNAEASRKRHAAEKKALGAVEHAGAAAEKGSEYLQGTSGLAAQAAAAAGLGAGFSLPAAGAGAAATARRFAADDEERAAKAAGKHAATEREQLVKERAAAALAGHGDLDLNARREFLAEHEAGVPFEGIVAGMAGAKGMRSRLQQAEIPPDMMDEVAGVVARKVAEGMRGRLIGRKADEVAADLEDEAASREMAQGQRRRRVAMAPVAAARRDATEMNREQQERQKAMEGAVAEGMMVNRGANPQAAQHAAHEAVEYLKKHGGMINDFGQNVNQFGQMVNDAFAMLAGQVVQLEAKNRQNAMRLNGLMGQFRGAMGTMTMKRGGFGGNR